MTAFMEHKGVRAAQADGTSALHSTPARRAEGTRVCKRRGNAGGSPATTLNSSAHPIANATPSPQRPSCGRDVRAPPHTGTPCRGNAGGSPATTLNSSAHPIAVMQLHLHSVPHADGTSALHASLRVMRVPRDTPLLVFDFVSKNLIPRMQLIKQSPLLLR
jgi:hypothetical protein